MEHEDELIENKHFISVQNVNANPRMGIPHTSTLWTKRGVTRLGFFIKSEQAKRFRDWAEDLVIKETTPQPVQPQTPASIPLHDPLERLSRRKV